MTVLKCLGVAITGMAAASAVQAQVQNGVEVPAGQDAVVIYTDGIERVRVDDEGQVGIGTDEPGFALELAGSDNPASRTVGIDGTPVLYLPDQANLIGSIAVGNGLQNLTHTTSDQGQYNTALGIGAMLNETTGYYQTAVGYQALKAGGDYGNTAIGFEAMFNTPTGPRYDNTAVGALALLNQLQGIDNVAIGIKAMQAFEVGSENVAVGGDSLLNLRLGDRNVAVGSMAGRFLANGVTAKEFGDESVYIGYQARGGVLDAAQNEIVIGAFAKGAGSNSVTLGNDDIAKTLLKGKVGIGTTDPDYDFVLRGENGFQVSDLAASTRLLLYTQSAASRAVIQTNIGQSLAFLVNGGGIEAARFDSLGNFGLGTSSFGTSASRVFGIGIGSAPATSPANMVQLWAQSIGGSAELRVMDESGNVTTLSPHNFSLIENGPSEDLAWSYYSEKGGTAINVDMLRVVRTVENLSGEQLVYTGPIAGDSSIQQAPVSDLAQSAQNLLPDSSLDEASFSASAVAENSSITTDSTLNAVALGNGAVAQFQNSTAVGTNAVASGENEVALGGTGSSVRVGDIAASTAAQSGEVALVTVDENGVLGRDSTIAPAVRTLQEVTSANSRRLDELQVSQQELMGRVDELFDVREKDLREMRRGVAVAVAIGSAPMPSAPGRTTYILNGSTFRGEQAVGGSIMHRLDTENPFAIGAGFSSAGGKNTAVRVGVAGEF